MVEYVVCVSMQSSIVENSCICLDKGTYVCMLLKKLIMDLKSWIQMHIMIENVCINSDMIENIFLWCKLHCALLLTVISSCTEQLDTIAYWCILLLIVTYCFKMLCMDGHGWARFCTAAGGCICANVHILLQIDANKLQYGRISLYMCWITYGCIYILEWMHDVNLILV